MAPFLRLGLIAAVSMWTFGASAEPRHGISTFGDLKYPAGFDHFDYVNPDAPKGGSCASPAVRERLIR